MLRYMKNGRRRRYALGRFPQMGLADARILPLAAYLATSPKARTGSRGPTPRPN